MSKWLTTDAILGAFGRHKEWARKAYLCFVRDGIGDESIWDGLNRQIYLGDDQFVARMQKSLDVSQNNAQIPKLHRQKPPPSLVQIYQRADSRDAAIVAAHATGEYSYTQIGALFGLNFAAVGRTVRKAKTGTQRK